MIDPLAEQDNTVYIFVLVMSLSHKFTPGKNINHCNHILMLVLPFLLLLHIKTYFLLF